MSDCASDARRKRLRMRAIATSSTATTAYATTRAWSTLEIKNGRLWNVPPRNVAVPVIRPRAGPDPRPVRGHALGVADPGLGLLQPASGVRMAMNAHSPLIVGGSSG